MIGILNSNYDEIPTDEFEFTHNKKIEQPIKRVGFAHSGNPSYFRDSYRSIKSDEFVSLKNNYHKIIKDNFTSSVLRLSDKVLNIFFNSKGLQTLFQAPYEHLAFECKNSHHEILIAFLAYS